MRDRLSNAEFEERDGVVVARLTGEIDGSNAVEMGRAISERLPTAAHGLVLDLSGVEYLDSTGIELLFGLARRLADRRQRLRLGVPESSPVRRVLEVCDVDSVAPVSESADEAAAAVLAQDA